jgi:hypothetical protein
MTETAANRVDLRDLFVSLQRQMTEHLDTNRKVLFHATTKGDATELHWAESISKFLPARYQVAKAFVIDADGNASQQLDLVIFDRQYCPLLFNQDGAHYIPAESVYAVFEVRPSLNKANLEYAGEKIASVRRLRWTSAAIPHAGGVHDPKRPFRILGGILTVESDWNPKLGQPLTDHLRNLAAAEKLDLGCALRDGSFEATYEGNEPFVSTSAADTALIFFMLRLLQRLQGLGTVPAIDLTEYAKVLGNP